MMFERGRDITRANAELKKIRKEIGRLLGAA
jgi:hypothetical protein